MENNFTHLHVHTVYSFLDGLAKINDLVAKAKSLGMTALAITDHNHLGGTYDFQKQCLEAGIKPVLGYEAYYNEDIDTIALKPEERKKAAATKALEDKVITQDEYSLLIEGVKNAKITKKSVEEKIESYMPDLKQYHVIFLAMNQEGWKNIIKLQSKSAERCTYNGRFICNDELMAKYSEGIICSTACIASRISRYINRDNDYDKAEELVLRWAEIFKDRFYLEIQPLAYVEQIKVNAFYLSMKYKHGLPVIATNDVHYVNKEDHDDHDTLLCIGTGKKKSDTERMKYTNDFWLRSYGEMQEAFKRQYDYDCDNCRLLNHQYLWECQCALEETNKLAARVDSDIKIGSDKPLIPQVKLNKGESPEGVLTVRCFMALYELADNDLFVAEHLHEYEKRLRYELDIIIPKGFASYLLVVDNYCKWANDNRIFTDFGRGSAAGSLCLYLLGVTKVIDPIKNGLMFERFLTKDRTAMPDVDIDFLYSGRDRLISYLEEYYTPECVCHIGTYTVSGVKSGIKDVCRVLEIDFNESNAITKQIDEINDTPQPKFKDFDNLKEDDPENWKKFDALEKKYPEVFRLARKFEGVRRQFGVHASGILAMPIPINEMVPTRVADGVRVALYTGPEVEEQNLLKLDILGLKTIDLVQKTLEAVDPNLDFNKFINALDMEDSSVFAMLTDKKTDGVFQLESDMFKGLVSSIKPTGLSDITAITSLGRPGPLSCGMPQQYAKRKNGEEEAVPLLRGMDDILKETFGNVVYQEQCMQIGVKAFGFNGNQSDSILRKIIAKKKKDKLEMLRRMIKYGKVNTEGPEGWHDNPDLPWYDPNGNQYGDPISGGLVNGYTEAEIDDFFSKLMEFASYCFNKSHAATYSALSYATAYLKYYYPVEFYAALLSIQSDDKIEKYSEVCEKEGVKIITPDINVSGKDFTPNTKGKSIYYGISSIKGVGASIVDEIIANQPYMSLEDIFHKLPKKVFNKRVAVAMAKSGALDSFDLEGNRLAILNRIYDIRKDKDERYDISAWNEDICIEFEKEVLNAPITFKPWWSTVKENKTVEEDGTIISYREQLDKKGNTMVFAKLRLHNCEVETVVFASIYRHCVGVFDTNLNPDRVIHIKGKKDEKGKLILSSASLPVSQSPWEVA